jgi:DNA topoisomerase-2
MKENKVKKLNFIEKVLKRPARFIGSTQIQTHTRHILNDETKKIEYKSIQYSPGLIKIFKEPLDNALDEAVRTNFKICNKIEITIKDGWIEIIDNGRGIPSEMGEDEHKVPTLVADLCWCHLDAGSNFDDEETNQTAGQNGEGVCLTNIFSKEFIGETQDGKLFTTLKCSNNLGTKDLNQSKIKNKKTFTKVKFLPDYSKFNVTSIEDFDHMALIKFDIINASVNFPLVDIYLNGELVKYSFSDYCGLFQVETYESFRYRGLDIMVFPSEEEFQFIHFINGINVNRGGTALDWVTDNIVDELRDKLSRGCKGIKPGDIKNKLGLIAIFYGMYNPRFEDQAKTICETTYVQFKSQIEDINFEKLGNTIYKNKVIIDPIIALFQAKASAEDMKAIKAKDKILKKKEVEKYKPAFKKKYGLILSEGDSAIDSVVANVGRENYGFLPTSGVPQSSLEKETSKIINSDKFADLAVVLGIEFSKAPKEVLNYEIIILGMDADYDGIHIIGLYLAFFYRYCPAYLFGGKIFIFKTPVAMLKDRNDKTIDVFLTQAEFEKYSKNPKAKYHTEIKKGLGSLSETEWDEFFNIIPFEKTLEPLIVKNKEAVEDILYNWLGDSNHNITYRKQQIIDYRKNKKET